jgi:hypothetical protein
MARSETSYPGSSDPKEKQMTEQDEQRGDPEIGVCHVCGQTFDTQLELSQHLMDVHEEDVLPPAGPPTE